MQRLKCFQKFCGFVVLVSVGFTTGLGQSNPRILIGPNVLVSWQGDCQYRELHLAADPTNSLNLFGSGICEQTRYPRLNKAAAADGSTQSTKSFISRDGGATWDLVSQAEFEYPNRTGDPIVAFGSTGTKLFAALGDIYEASGKPVGGRKILVFRQGKQDAGWNGPTVLTYMDHPMIVTDLSQGKRRGNIYLSGLMRDRKISPKFAKLGLYRSIDDGKTWQGPTTYATNSHNMDLGLNTSTPAVFSDGELFVPFHSWGMDDFRKAPESRLYKENPTRYHFVTSKDGGVTFSKPANLTTLDNEDIGGGSEVWVASDTSSGPFRDRLYGAWIDNGLSNTAIAASKSTRGGRPGGSRVYFSFSENRGKSWSKPMLVAPSDRGGQFDSATIAVNRDGVVAVSWYDTRNTPADAVVSTVDRYMATSIDGGKTFLPAVRVSSDSSTAGGPTGFSFSVKGSVLKASAIRGAVDGSDYVGMTADKDGTFHLFWEDGRTGSRQIWTAAVRVEKNSVGGPDPAGLVEADITDLIEILPDPIDLYPPQGTIAVRIRLRNKSDKVVYGPLKLEVVSVKPTKGQEDVSPFLNGVNDKSGAGAIFDYSRALGTADLLRPGAASESVLWSFKQPPSGSGLPEIKTKITGRVNRQDQPVASRPQQ